MLLAPVENEKFRYEHLISTPQNLEEIKTFTVAKQTGKGFGEQVFRSFIIPTVKYGAELFGIQALHIYALPEDELLVHYGSFGFSRLPQEMEAYIHQHLKPDYDESCIFMYQLL